MTGDEVVRFALKYNAQVHSAPYDAISFTRAQLIRLIFDIASPETVASFSDSKTYEQGQVNFKRAGAYTVVMRRSDTDAYGEDQSVQSNLLLAILEELRKP